MALCGSGGGALLGVVVNSSDRRSVVRVALSGLELNALAFWDMVENMDVFPLLMVSSDEFFGGDVNADGLDSVRPRVPQELKLISSGRDEEDEGALSSEDSPPSLQIFDSATLSASTALFVSTPSAGRPLRLCSFCRCISLHDVAAALSARYRLYCFGESRSIWELTSSKNDLNFGRVVESVDVS